MVDQTERWFAMSTNVRAKPFLDHLRSRFRSVEEGISYWQYYEYVFTRKPIERTISWTVRCLRDTRKYIVGGKSPEPRRKIRSRGKGLKGAFNYFGSLYVSALSQTNCSPIVPP